MKKAKQYYNCDDCPIIATLFEGNPCDYCKRIHQRFAVKDVSEITLKQGDDVLFKGKVISDEIKSYQRRSKCQDCHLKENCVDRIEFDK